MSTFRYKRVFDATDGRPEVLEVAFGWCPQFCEKRRLVTGVNWSAAIISPFRSLGETGVSLDSMLAHLYCGEDEEVVIVMHYLTSVKGLPVDVLKRIAGHADLATTLKYYTNETDRDAADVRAALANSGMTKLRTPVR